MATRVDRQPAVGAGGTAGREHALRLPGECHHLFRSDPEAGRGQAGRVIIRVLGCLSGDDDEKAPALVVAKPELADGPFGVSRLSRRQLNAFRRRAQALGLEELADADDQALDMELLTVEHEVVFGPACPQEELALARSTYGADADPIHGIEVYASGHGVRVPFCTICEAPFHPDLTAGFGASATGKATGVIR